MTGLYQITQTTARQARLEPIYYVITLFFGALAYGAIYYVRFVFGERGPVILETGLASVSACGLLLALLLSWLLVRREMGQMSVLSVLSKPISRYSYVVGKFLGIGYAILLAMLFVLLMFLLSMAINAGPDLVERVQTASRPTGGYLSSVFTLLGGGLEQFYRERISFALQGGLPLLSMMGIVLSFCLVCSLHLRVLPTAVLTVFFLVLGSLSGNLHRSLLAGDSVFGTMFGWLVALLLPDFQMMDVSSEVGRGMTLGGGYLVSVTLSAILYTGIILLLGAASFQRKEV